MITIGIDNMSPQDVDAKKRQDVIKTIFDRLNYQKQHPTDSDNTLSLGELKEAIANGWIDLNEKHYNPQFQTSLLHAAVRAKNQAVVEYLLEQPSIDINACSSSNDTALHQAAYDGDENLMLKLINKGAKLTTINIRGETSLKNAFGNSLSDIELGHKLVGRLIDQIFESEHGFPKNISIVGDKINFSLPQGDLLNKLKKYELPKTSDLKFVSLNIGQLQEFLIQEKYIIEQDKRFIDLKGVQESYNISSAIEDVGVSITEPMSYIEWLKLKYGVICCGERGDKNSNKSTSMLYSFDTPEQRNQFSNAFPANIRPATFSCYKTDFNGKPALVLANIITPKVDYNAVLYQKYKQDMDKIFNANLDKLSIPDLHKLQQQQQQALNKTTETRALIQKHDQISGMGAKPKRGDIWSQSNSRLDAFQGLVAETKEGEQFYRSIAGYKLSLEAFISSHADMLSDKQIKALEIASTTLMGSGTDAVATGLKADSNFVDFLWGISRRKQTGQGGLDLQGYSPSYDIGPKLAEVIAQDAEHLLSGAVNRLVIDQHYTKQIIDNSQEFLFGKPNDNLLHRNIPRFFPDISKTPISETDEIILQTGGSAAHSTMVRIWKQKKTINGQDYYRFFRTEYNTGAGCHNVNWSNNTCAGTYTTEISGEHFDEHGNVKGVLPDPAAYHQKMKDSLLKLIQSERRILLYNAPTKGPNGEAASNSPQEIKHWNEERDAIKKFGGCPDYSKNPPLTGHYRAEYSRKAILQMSGNCTIKSQRQLLEDVLIRKGNLTEEEARTLIQLHFGWAQGHNCGEVRRGLETQQTQIQSKIDNIQRAIKLKEQITKDVAEAESKKVDYAKLSKTDIKSIDPGPELQLDPKDLSQKYNIGSLNIELIKGSPLHQKTNVLVNAASVDGLDVGGWGGIAGAIYEQLKHDDAVLKANWQKEWRAGGQVVTGKAKFVCDTSDNPVKLNFKTKSGTSFDKYLIHAGSPHGPLENNPTGKQQLIDAYFNILLELKKFNDVLTNVPKITSVTIPPLGIGLYGVEPEISADCAAAAIEKFYNENQKISQLKIIVALHQESGYKEPNNQFGEELAKRLTQLKEQENQAKHKKSIKTAEPLKQGAQEAKLAEIKKKQAEAEHENLILAQQGTKGPIKSYVDGVDSIDVADDGNCFYYAVAAALNVQNQKQPLLYSQQHLRDIVADYINAYMRKEVAIQLSPDVEINKIELQKELQNLEAIIEIHRQDNNFTAIQETEEKISRLRIEAAKLNAVVIEQKDIDKYIHDIRSTAKWADGLAIAALSKALGITIVVTSKKDSMDTAKIVNKFEVAGGLPIFVHFDGVDGGNPHYQALIVKPEANGVAIIEKLSQATIKAKEAEEAKTKAKVEERDSRTQVVTEEETSFAGIAAEFNKKKLELEKAKKANSKAEAKVEAEKLKLAQAKPKEPIKAKQQQSPALHLDTKSQKTSITKLSELEKNLYSTAIEQHFNLEEIKRKLPNTQYTNASLIQDKEAVIGEIISTSTTSQEKPTVFATVKQDSIECPLLKTTGKDNFQLIDVQQKIFIEFLRFQSTQATHENPIIIEAVNFNPHDLNKLLTLLAKEDKIPFIKIDLPPSADQCIYGNNQQYTSKQFQIIKQKITDYNKFSGDQLDSPRSVVPSSHSSRFKP